MKVSIICFSTRGEGLAFLLREGLENGRLFGEELSLSVTSSKEISSLKDWTREHFTDGGLIFVGACGIAVRAIAPYIRDKQTDPAVVCVDETGEFAVPILSGHLGGANELAVLAARAVGAVPVITTATDRHRVFAVDSWARENNCVIDDPKKIKAISSLLLDGGTVRFYFGIPVEGSIPSGIVLVTEEENADAVVSVYKDEAAGEGKPLRIIPRIITVGIGCKAGVTPEEIGTAVDGVLSQAGLAFGSLDRIATIEMKKDEPGLTAFCKRRGIPLCAFSSEELDRTEGFFTDSNFVKTITGVGNVCERSAVCASGGKLLVPKTVFGRVTAACAIAQKLLKWESEKWD